MNNNTENKEDYYFKLAMKRHDEIIMFNQSLIVYNNLPWYKKIFIKEVEIKCQYEKGFNCCCRKHKNK